ncbi:MAG: TonB-dependent receptor, partial [Cellvibrionaceae bacterium]|nr:TonB-dependent receptor [Cellvibrionaceae bacterium]
QDVYIGEPGWNQYNTESTQFTLLARHQLNDVFELKATALWRDGEADYNQAWAAFTGDGNSRFLNDIVGVAVATPTTVPRSFYQADNSSEQLAADIRLSAEFDTGAIGHEILFGVQYQDVTTDNNTAYFYGGGALSGDFSYALDLANPVYTGAPPQAVFDALYNDRPEQNVEDIGWYISNQMSIDNWRITLGLRRDEVDNDDGSRVQNDSATSLSGGVLYQFDNGLSPYLSYAESFETVIGTDVANRQLKPEEGRQYEAGLKFEPESFPGLITLAYFDIEISNLPNPNSLPNDAGQQQGVSELKGFEAEAKLQLGDFDIQASASVLDAQDPNGYELAATPDKHASLWLGWRPSEQWQGFKAGIGIRHVGRSINQTASLRYVSDSYTLGDLMLGYELDEHWDLALNVRNISDEEYLTSCLTRGDCFPGVRRSAVASVRYNF